MCICVCKCAVSHFLVVEDVGYMSQPLLSDKTWCIAGYLSPGSCIFTPCLPLGLGKCTTMHRMAVAFVT